MSKSNGRNGFYSVKDGMKECVGCKVSKPEDNFAKYAYTTNGGNRSLRISPNCKECVKKYRARPEVRTRENLNQKRIRDKNNSDVRDAGKQKECGHCGETKLLIDFYLHSRSADGRSYSCKKCISASRKKYSDEQLKDPEYKKKRSERARVNTLRGKYGLSYPEFLAMAESQDKKCLICKMAPEILCVDHCHKTGRVRGLLCKRCNWALGNISDNYDTALSLAKYIKENCHF